MVSRRSHNIFSAWASFLIWRCANDFYFVFILCELKHITAGVHSVGKGTAILPEHIFYHSLCFWKLYVSLIEFNQFQWSQYHAILQNSTCMKLELKVPVAESHLIFGRIPFRQGDCWETPAILLDINLPALLEPPVLRVSLPLKGDRGQKKMQSLGVFVAILSASLATGLLLEEEEERAVVQGSHCDYIMFVLTIFYCLLRL